MHPRVHFLCLVVYLALTYASVCVVSVQRFPVISTCGLAYPTAAVPDSSKAEDTALRLAEAAKVLFLMYSFFWVLAYFPGWRAWTFARGEYNSSSTEQFVQAVSSPLCFNDEFQFFRLLPITT